MGWPRANTGSWPTNKCGFSRVFLCFCACLPAFCEIIFCFFFRILVLSQPTGSPDTLRLLAVVTISIEDSRPIEVPRRLTGLKCLLHVNTLTRHSRAMVTNLKSFFGNIGAKNLISDMPCVIVVEPIDDGYFNAVPLPGRHPRRQPWETTMNGARRVSQDLIYSNDFKASLRKDGSPGVSLSFLGQLNFSLTNRIRWARAS